MSLAEIIDFFLALARPAKPLLSCIESCALKRKFNALLDCVAGRCMVFIGASSFMILFCGRAQALVFVAEEGIA